MIRYLQHSHLLSGPLIYSWACNKLSPYRKYCFIVLIYLHLIYTTTKDFIWARFVSPVDSVGIFKIKVLANVVVEGNSTTNKGTCLPVLHIWPSHLPSRASEWKPRMLPLSLCSESQTAFHCSVNRCHLVSKVCKYSPPFLRSSEVSQTKNNQFLLSKDKGKKNSNGQSWGWLLKAKAERARWFRTGSGWSQKAWVPPWPLRITLQQWDRGPVTYPCYSFSKMQSTSSVYQED